MQQYVHGAFLSFLKKNSLLRLLYIQCSCYLALFSRCSVCTAAQLGCAFSLCIRYVCLSTNGDTTAALCHAWCITGSPRSGPGLHLTISQLGDTVFCVYDSAMT